MDFKIHNFQVPVNMGHSAGKGPAVAEHPVLLPAGGTQSEAPELKAMMDLAEMKNFLYMMIGSTVKVDPSHREPGRHFDSVA